MGCTSVACHSTIDSSYRHSNHSRPLASAYSYPSRTAREYHFQQSPQSLGAGGKNDDRNEKSSGTLGTATKAYGRSKKLINFFRIYTSSSQLHHHEDWGQKFNFIFNHDTT